MILRIEESRSPGDASGKRATHGAATTARKARDPDLARTNLAAIEMAVVLIVAALVMVSIILSTGCSSRLPPDLSAAHTSQAQHSQAAPVDPQRLETQPGSVAWSRSAPEVTRSGRRLEAAKRKAPQAEVSDLSVGS